MKSLSVAGAVIAGAALITSLACRQPPEGQTNSSTTPPPASTAAGSPEPPAADTTASPVQTLCTQITPAALSAITSASYAETSSQIDTATMKHCEYRGGQDTVSIMLVTGSGAQERFDLSTRFPGIEPVSGIGDHANWEPVRGTLSLIAGDRAVEVRISKSHGADAARQQFARAIAQLLLP